MEEVVRETGMTPVGYLFMLTSWTVIIAAAGYCFTRILGDGSNNNTSENPNDQKGQN